MKKQGLDKEKIGLVFKALSQAITPHCELEHETVLDLLVAVVLSAQTTDKSVNKVTAELWKTCRSCEDYLALGEEGIAEKIRSIGLYRNKAKAIVGMCAKLLSDFGGTVPQTREELMSLPGVGRKTANVVMNVGYGLPTLAVDTHVFRVANRIGLVHESTVGGVEKALLQCVPEEYLVNAHHYLLLLGRYTCKAQRPECELCPIRDVCLKMDVVQKE